jgi:hypothetical protein
MLAERFADGSLLLAIVVLIALEAALLLWLWYGRGRGLAPRDHLGNLVSGAFLMMAVRAALLDQAWTLVATWLIGALSAHMIDMVARWRRREGRAAIDTT